MHHKTRNTIILIIVLISAAAVSYAAMRYAAIRRSLPSDEVIQSTGYPTDPAGGTEDADTGSTDPGGADTTESSAAESPRFYALIEQWKTSEYYDLSVDTELKVEDGLGGYNIVRIRDGAVEVTEANCPDKVCVYSLPLSEPGYGGLIACMPHALYITVVTEDEVPESYR